MVWHRIIHNLGTCIPANAPPLYHFHPFSWPLFFLRTISETRTSASSIQHSIDSIMFVPAKVADMGWMGTIPQLILSWSAVDAAWQLHTPRSLAREKDWSSAFISWLSSCFFQQHPEWRVVSVSVLDTLRGTKAPDRPWTKFTIHWYRVTQPGVHTIIAWIRVGGGFSKQLLYFLQHSLKSPFVWFVISPQFYYLCYTLHLGCGINQP